MKISSASLGAFIDMFLDSSGDVRRSHLIVRPFFCGSGRRPYDRQHHRTKEGTKDLDSTFHWSVLVGSISGAIKSSCLLCRMLRVRGMFAAGRMVPRVLASGNKTEDKESRRDQKRERFGRFHTFAVPLDLPP